MGVHFADRKAASEPEIEDASVEVREVLVSKADEQGVIAFFGMQARIASRRNANWKSRYCWTQSAYFGDGPSRIWHFDKTFWSSAPPVAMTLVPYR